MAGDRKKREMVHRQVKRVCKSEISRIFGINLLFFLVCSWHLELERKNITLKTNARGLEGIMRLI
jgi:hypothetical protein